MQKLAIKFSDGVILEDEEVSPEVIQYAQSLGLPVLPYQTEDKCEEAYKQFYDQVLG